MPKEDGATFENTQEAIIDKQSFETVQKIRQIKADLPIRVNELSDGDD